MVYGSHMSGLVFCGRVRNHKKQGNLLPLIGVIYRNLSFGGEALTDTATFYTLIAMSVFGKREPK